MHLYGAVAQLVERPTPNRKVLGSIPGSSSSFKQRIRERERERERERGIVYTVGKVRKSVGSVGHFTVLMACKVPDWIAAKCLVLASSPENLSALN